MGRNLMAQISKYLTTRRRRQIGYWTLCGLGAVVVFCTTYALILPAITMSNEPICGMEAHTHTESCWSLQAVVPGGELICEDWKEADVVFHQHNDFCYNGEGDLICPLEELEPHVHDESCYEEQRELICGEEEEAPGESGEEPVRDEPRREEEAPRAREPRQVHIHSDECYSLERGELTCGLEEVEGHWHDDSCYSLEPTGEYILTCAEEESDIFGYDELGEFHSGHQHSDSCYQPAMEQIMTCGLEEVEGHQHDDSCYEWEEVLVCTEEETGESDDYDDYWEEPEEEPEEPEIPAAPEAHVHTEECYEVTTVLACGEEEYILHTHDALCYETILEDDGEGGENVITRLICELPVVVEHQHTEECVRIEEIDAENRETMVRTCGMEVHVHTDECFVPLGPDPDPWFCGMSEHEHTEECYFESGTLRCTIPEHVHTDECLDAENFAKPEYPLVTPVGHEYICGQEAHKHADECWSEDGELICGLEEHTHDETCLLEEEENGEDGQDGENNEIEYICGLEEHEHTEACWSEEGDLTCGLEWHVHDETCLPEDKDGETEYICGLEEHEHADECRGEDGELTCGLEEHVHTDECLKPEADIVTLDETFTAESEDGAVILTLHVKGEIALPETGGAEAETDATAADTVEAETGFQLVLTESEDTAAYEEYEALAAEQGEVMMVQVFNYVLTYDGQEVDLSDCEVAAEVTPTEAFEEMLNASAGDLEGMLNILSETYDDMADDDGGSQEETLSDAPVPMTSADALDDENADLDFYGHAEGGVMAYAVTQGQGANPSFTVQYYANLERAVRTSSGVLPVIDTDNKSDANNSNKGGILPTNKGNTTASPNDKPLAYLSLKDGKIKTETTLTEIYQAENFEYQRAPGLKYFNIVLTNETSHYTLAEIWVLDEGGNADGIDKNGWTVYQYTTETRFTNRPETAANNSNYILIDEGTLIRLVYNTKETNKDFPANFYDYDISNGRVHRAKPPENPDQYVYKTAGQTFNGDSLTNEVLNWAAGLSDWDGHLYAYTKERGINISGNYSGSGTKLAFGNVNTGTNLGRLTWTSKDKNGVSVNNELNKYNNKGYQGCTFGIAESLTRTDEYGNINYTSGINAPKLFSEDGAIGKTSYSNKEYSLNFERVGDTYTLSAVNGTKTGSLTKFSNPTNSTGTHGNIWTNNFWPMDSAPSFGTGTHDVKFGATKTFKGAEHEIRFGPITQKDSDYTFPESDDGQYHNSYFGMEYAVTFDLTSSYVGPLEYYFFGDDDMWVFLDGKLVCDIGGVHSSVGEYVNLWDWIDRSEFLEESDGTLKPKKVVKTDENGQPVQAKDKNDQLLYEEDGTTPIYEMTDLVRTYTLKFFYTERGASGSTCWMQFTLPTVVGLDLKSVLDKQVDEDTGAISIEKRLDGVENTEWFIFEIAGLLDNYAPIIQTANGDLITETEDVKEYVGYKKNPDDEEIIFGDSDFIGGTAYFRIREGDILLVKGLQPYDDYYDEDGNLIQKGSQTPITVTEIGRSGYHTTIKVDGKEIGDGAADVNTTGNLEVERGHRIQVVFTNHAIYELPETGGSPAIMYTLGGTLLLTAAGCGLVYKKRPKRRGGADRT